MAAVSTPASAYYHFIQYLSAGNAPQKFDLNALPGKTVTFFVSENGPTTYAQDDVFNSVLSQVRQAAAVWNGVASSDLRVAFGGLENGATPQSAPGGDVVFEDLPPGIYGYGGPTSTLAPVTPVGGTPFVPVTRSTVHLNRNLTLAPGPSYQETFFMTVVHEMGHALGLQHTFTSSTMSQATTRATTLSHPIDNDDIAGISVLYPNANFAQFGSITGRITNGGQGVHLASVVAVHDGSGAVSGITNPDGTYRIDGVPPGPYFIYVHTMPPDADIKGPWNADGSLASISGPVNALFYPGTPSYSQALPISVQSGKTAAGINIATSSLPAVPVFDGGVYGYLNNNTVVLKPAPLNMNGGPVVVSASVTGLGSNGQAPGLQVQLMGGSASVLPNYGVNGVSPYLANGFTYIGIYLGFNLGGQPGPQHMVFTSPGYTYLLPSAVNLTLKPPPTVNSVALNPDGTVSVTGTNWDSATAIYFDGLPAGIATLNPAAGIAVVTPPVGAPGQRAIVTAYNSDGQNSQFVQSASPVEFAYGPSAAPAINSVSPSSLPAGAEALVDIVGTGFNFVQGQTTVGFGTSDIVVRRVFVLAPNHVQADVSIAPGAILSNPDVTVMSGFQLATLPAGFQITASQLGLPTPVPVLVNAGLGLTGSYAGAFVTIYGANLAPPNGSSVVTIGGQAVPVLFSSPTQINLQLPPTLPVGPAVMVVSAGGANSFPVLVNIDTPPATITAVQSLAGVNITQANPAHTGDAVGVTLAGFAPAGTSIAPSRVQVSVGGVLRPALVLNGLGAAWQVVFQLNAGDPIGPADQLIVYLDGRSSQPGSIPVGAGVTPGS